MFFFSGGKIDYNYLFIYFGVLSLHFFVGFSLVVERGGHSLGVVCRLLIAVASLVAERTL